MSFNLAIKNYVKNHKLAFKKNKYILLICKTDSYICICNQKDLRYG